MKNFVLGVASAVLAGVAIFLFQDWYSGLRDRNEKVISQTIYKPAFTINKKNTENWFKDKAGNDSDFYEQVIVSLVKIKNTGMNPIVNQEVTIRPTSEEGIEPGILTFETYQAPGDDKSSISTSLNDGILKIKYSLLKPGDSHMFWIAHDRWTEPTFIARAADLESEIWTKGVDADENEEGTDFAGWMAMLAVAFLVFVAGGLLDSAITDNLLKKRGYNLKEMLKEEPQASGEDD